ncbi:hypothetical protein M5K25_009709 [Dendrobium thyrsiflorum]|uniref:Uncharacterized protein n=1 Tax=Dendrobium thyrsiflorum TaxID=117978 RepID=A0ABD0V764_DENTH
MVSWVGMGRYSISGDKSIYIANHRMSYITVILITQCATLNRVAATMVNFDMRLESLQSEQSATSLKTISMWRIPFKKLGKWVGITSRKSSWMGVGGRSPPAQSVGTGTPPGPHVGLCCFTKAYYVSDDL